MISLQDLFIQKVSNFAPNTLQMINYNGVCVLKNLTNDDNDESVAFISQIVSPDEPHEAMIPRLNFLISQKCLASPGATDVIGQNHLNTILKFYTNFVRSKDAALYFIEKGGWQVLFKIFEWNNEGYSYDPELEIEIMQIVTNLTRWVQANM